MESRDTFSEGVKNLRSTLASLTVMETELFCAMQTDQPVVLSLLEALNRSDSEADTISLLNLIEGTCLLHYGSKYAFRNISHMEKLLSFLQSKNKKLLLACIDTLEAILVDSSEMHRLFEGLGGLLLISNIVMSLKEQELKEAQLKAVELLVLYLSPESNYPDSNTTTQKRGECNSCSSSNGAGGSGGVHFLPDESKKQFVAKLLGPQFVQKIMDTLLSSSTSTSTSTSTSDGVGTTGENPPSVAAAAESQEDSRRDLNHGNSKQNHHQHKNSSDIVHQVHERNMAHGCAPTNNNNNPSKKRVVIGNGPRVPRKS